MDNITLNNDLVSARLTPPPEETECPSGNACLAPDRTAALDDPPTPDSLPVQMADRRQSAPSPRPASRHSRKSTSATPRRSSSSSAVVSDAIFSSRALEDVYREMAYLGVSLEKQWAYDARLWEAMMLLEWQMELASCGRERKILKKRQRTARIRLDQSGQQKTAIMQCLGLLQIELHSLDDRRLARWDLERRRLSLYAPRGGQQWASPPPPPPAPPPPPPPAPPPPPPQATGPPLNAACPEFVPRGAKWASQTLHPAQEQPEPGYFDVQHSGWTFEDGEGDGDGSEDETRRRFSVDSEVLSPGRDRRLSLPNLCPVTE
ncbi:hypothetical protein N3K66_009001 [Trichothecium roseum]|uniref:Uncharacterized protein n=1 Tax=Trichothecium roseum TaxID=47278 RepID=A0ACC0UR23_9HYPO|nr:hypothetical protein N3K66_009001 [Trichothecium roseum]